MGLIGQCIPFNEMDTRGCFYNAADLARLEGKSSIFKLLLHITTAKEATVKSEYMRMMFKGCQTYRSPDFLALLQSDSDIAMSPRVASPE